MKNAKLLVSALAVAAVGCGVSACSPNAITAAGQGPAARSATEPAVTGGGSGLGAGSPMTAGFTTAPGHYLLGAMPTGTVTVERGTHGHLQAQVTMFGLTPGSSHAVSIEGPLGHPVRFPALTANAAGQADATLTSVDRVSWVRLGRFVIRLGDTAGDPLAAEPIAETTLLPVRPGAMLPLHAVTFAASGARLGRPAGQATLAYNAAAQTLTITLTASGLNPGPHAAHIHLGSCQNQGGVKYMMTDFTADAAGNIVNQTRVVTGVASVPGPGNWYLNLHQGGMNQILANGAPTLSFRPMLCADITSFAMTGTTPAVPPTGTPSVSPTGTMPAGTMPTGTMPTGTPTMTMPAGTPSMTAPAGTPTATAPAGTPAPTSTPTSGPTAVPTHY